MRLSDFLRAGAARPFVWGEADCCTFACDWVLTRLGKDPALPWRGRYRTARGAARHLLRGAGAWPLSGALIPISAKAMESAGLQPTDAPKPGDIGLVETSNGFALAIRTRTGWACKSPGGITVAPFHAFSVWTHPCLRS